MEPSGEASSCMQRAAVSAGWGASRLSRFPGGDAAVLNPPRIALAILASAGVREVPGLEDAQTRMLLAMLERNVNCPKTTSLGRLFDAAAAVLGLVEAVSYEGEGPIRLEGSRAAGPRIGCEVGPAERRNAPPLSPAARGREGFSSSIRSLSFFSS